MSQEKDLFTAVAGDGSESDDIQLPNWREVNKAKRALRQAETATSQRRRSGEGLHITLLQDVRRRHPNDPRKQITLFLSKATIPAAIGRRREVSEKTRTEYGNLLQQCVTDLLICNLPIQNLTDLNQKHVIALVRFWGDKQGNAEGTIAWRVSILRRFLTLVGKTAAVPKGREWKHMLQQRGIVAGTLGRTYLPELPKGWLDLGIDPVPVIAAVRAEEPVIGSCLEMMWGFGLRVNESVQIQPGQSDNGDHLIIYRGTKGGKLRRVKFSDEPARRAWQREILERAKVLAGKHSKGVLAIKGLNLVQMKNRLRYLVTSHGISKSGLGITPHGLRHQFGTDLFKALCGLPAPVLQAAPQEEYAFNAEKVQAAFLEVSRQMGHERPSITGAYVSSVPKMDRLERARLERWLEIMAGCESYFQAAGVSEAWLIGKCASGLAIPDDCALQVAVRMAPQPDGAAKLRDLRQALSISATRRVAIWDWVEPDRPDDGTEILIGQSPFAHSLATPPDLTNNRTRNGNAA